MRRHVHRHAHRTAQRKVPSGGALSVDEHAAVRRLNQHAKAVFMCEARDVLRAERRAALPFVVDLADQADYAIAVAGEQS